MKERRKPVELYWQEEQKFLHYTLYKFYFMHKDSDIDRLVTELTPHCLEILNI